eukprot:g19988.t1
MSEASLAAQRAAVAAMRAYEDLTHLVPAANIFDRNQRPEVFPCVIVGEGQVVSDDIDCADTSEVYLDLHVWTDEDGFVACKSIAGEIRRGLRRLSTTLDGFKLNFIFNGARREQSTICSFANSREQAALTFREMAGICRATPRILEAVTIQDTAKRIHYRKMDIAYEALSSDGKNAHGRTDVCAFWDEGHGETKNELLEAVDTGLNKSANTLLLSASTAGIGRTGPFWAKYEKAKKVTDGRIEDDTFLPILFEAPQDVDHRDEEWLFATNPGLPYGYPNLKKLRRYIKDAEHSPDKRESFKRLHLSIYLDGAANPEWDLSIWDEGHGEIDLEALRGRKAWIAVDLSKRIDLSAVVATIELDDGRFAVHCMGFTPEAQIRKRATADGAPYAQWVEEGWMTACPGDIVDRIIVEDHVRMLCDILDVQECVFDVALARELMENLEADGIPVAAFQQTLMNFAKPVDTFEDMFLNRRLVHDSPLLRWAVGNTVMMRDQNDNRRPNKARAADRIDPCVAAIMSVSRAAQGLERAASKMNQKTSEMESRSAKFARTFEGNITGAVEKVNGALGKLGLGGLAAGGIAGILSSMSSIARGVAEVGDQAKIAGVNVMDFQRLKYVAEQNRIGIDSLTDGLKELNLRADEFIITGQGSAAEAFRRLGYDAQTLKVKLKDPSALFAEIIGRLGQLDKAAQIRVADEVFGGSGGEKFVQLISQGEAGIRSQIQAANQLGIVLDEQMIAKAAQVDAAFNTIATTVSMKLKQAVVEAAGALKGFLDVYDQYRDRQRLSDAAGQIGAMVNGPFTPKSTPAAPKTGRLPSSTDILRQKLIEQRLAEAFNPMSGGGVSTGGGSGKTDLTQYLAGGKDARHITGMSSSFEGKLTAMFAALPKELAGQIKINSGYRSEERQQQLWNDALRKYGSVAEARKWVAPPGKSQHNAGNAADLGYGSDAARQWAHANASKFGLSFPLSNEAWHIEDADARGKDMADKGKELEGLGKSYDDIIERARQFVADQGIEVQALSMTEQAAAKLRYEQELLNEAKAAGITLNPQQSEALRQLASEMASAEAETRRLTESQEAAKEAAAEFSQAAGGIAKGFVSDLMRGATAADALRNALGRIADMALDGLFNQLFGGGKVEGGGLFGKLFSDMFSGVGKRENGGPVTAGKPYIVGERRPELFVPSTSGTIVPRLPTAPTLKATGAGAQTVKHESALTVHINGANGDEHVRMLVQQGVGEALSQQQKSMERGGFGAMQANYEVPKDPQRRPAERDRSQKNGKTQARRIGRRDRAMFYRLIGDRDIPLGEMSSLVIEGPLKDEGKLQSMTGCEILGKAEFLNPGQSVKDRAALFIIRDAERKGLLKPGGVIVEGTAGNTGIGLTLVAKALGYRTVIVIPETQSQEKKDALKLLGAELVEVPAVPYKNPNNYVKVSGRLAEQLARSEPAGAIWANQFDNVANREAHVETTAAEIWAQTDGKVDGFVCAVGSGGTLAGTALGLRNRNPAVKIGLADPEGAALYEFYEHGEMKSEGSSITEGIGQGRITANLEGFTPDFSYRITDAEALPIIFDLVEREGLCLGGSSGINIAGAIRLAGDLGPGHTIVTVLCDYGNRYQSKLFNPDFLRSKALPLLYRDDFYLATSEAVVTAVHEDGGIELDRTCFYATSGGQPGDTGHLTRADGTRIMLGQTRHGATKDIVIHVPLEGQPAPQVGEAVSLQIDWERRVRLMRMHTACHLLSVVCPYPITGAAVGVDESRVDFDLSDAVDKDEVTAALMALVTQDHPVRLQWITDEELAANPGIVKSKNVRSKRRARKTAVSVSGSANPWPTASKTLAPVAGHSRRMPMSETSRFVVSSDWLAKELGAPDLKVVDASFYLPAQNRDADAEYLAGHIPGAVRFDHDKIADHGTSLPHMVPSPEVFAEAVGRMGISETDRIVIYDGPGIFSAPRGWWLFRIMGARSVFVLDGGLDGWKAEGRALETALPSPVPVTFTPDFRVDKVIDFHSMLSIVSDGTRQVADARSAGRFTGAEAEPRAGLRSGHMPGARNLPSGIFSAGGKLKSLPELRQAIEDAGLDMGRPIVTSCGSGITAAIITLALESLGHEDNALYDGSWTEWGARAEAPTAIMRAPEIPLHFYRYLYRQIGKRWQWYERLRMSDEELSSVIHDAAVSICVLYVDGAPAGFFELARRDAELVELSYFGLFERAMGLGIGKWFLLQALYAAWQNNPARVTVATNNFDHPRAIQLYQMMGFSPRRKRVAGFNRSRHQRSSPQEETLMPPIQFTPMPTEDAERFWSGGTDAYGLPCETKVADGPGYPCRHCLADIKSGERLLILAYRPFDTLHPYAETGPIFLHEKPCRRYECSESVPPILSSPDYIVRGYGFDDRIVYGTGAVTPTGEIPARAQALLERDDIAYLHVRSARNNCYQCRVDRTGARGEDAAA